MKINTIKWNKDFGSPIFVEKADNIETTVLLLQKCLSNNIYAFIVTPF